MKVQASPGDGRPSATRQALVCVGYALLLAPLVLVVDALLWYTGVLDTVGIVISVLWWLWVSLAACYEASGPHFDLREEQGAVRYVQSKLEEESGVDGRRCRVTIILPPGVSKRAVAATLRKAVREFAHENPETEEVLIAANWASDSIELGARGTARWTRPHTWWDRVHCQTIHVTIKDWRWNLHAASNAQSADK